MLLFVSASHGFPLIIVFKGKKKKVKLKYFTDVPVKSFSIWNIHLQKKKEKKEKKETYICIHNHTHTPEL